MRVAKTIPKAILPLLLVLLVAGAAVWFWPGRSLPSSEAAAAGNRRGGECTQLRAGEPGRHSMTTQRGLGYAVITPTDYSSQHRYGLLVLFPPAGFSRHAAERFYRITHEATAAGYIVALSDALPLSSHAMRAQADVVAEVAGRWCVDADRIVLAGHSDGGLIAQGSVLKTHVPSAPLVSVVSSAAGIQQSDLTSETCPPPSRITLLHPAKDERFPDYGWGVAQWWAACFACQPLTNEPSPGTCVDAQACTSMGSVRFCKTTGSHAQYPPAFGEQLKLLLQELLRS
jgi:polyhydroxybutyrate depolymerase